jgi:hypothetical protein
MKNQIWVVRWEYSDRSAFGNVRAYDTEAEAVALQKLLETYCDTRTFFVDTVEFTRHYD